ncbi:hypothetical protein [Clostridium perfringens]|uniref:hypothetical protein n=1 Tax=Clostridium perfringens TaxID=1502 RepID=UPI0034A32195
MCNDKNNNNKGNSSKKSQNVKRGIFERRSINEGAEVVSKPMYVKPPRPGKKGGR